MKSKNSQDKQAYLEASELAVNEGHDSSQIQPENFVASTVDGNTAVQMDGGLLVDKNGVILAFNPHDVLFYEDNVLANAVKNVVLAERALYVMIADPKVPIEHLQKIALHAAMFRTQIPPDLTFL